MLTAILVLLWLTPRSSIIPRVLRNLQKRKWTPKTIMHYPQGVISGSELSVSQGIPLVSNSYCKFDFPPLTSLLLTHDPVICRYPTGLATNESGTRRISASFRKKPTSTLQRQPWQPHTQWPQLCRTTRPIRPPRQILVRTGRSLPAQPRQP